MPRILIDHCINARIIDQCNRIGTGECYVTGKFETVPALLKFADIGTCNFRIFLARSKAL